MTELDGSSTDKRSQILRAAARVFAAKGFHKAKVEEIALEAGVGKGTVYEYFSSKKELFREMFKSCSMFYLETFRRRLADEKSVKYKLRQIIVLHLEFIQRHSEIAMILLHEHAEIGEQLHQWMLEKQEEKIAFIKELIQQGIDDGELRNMDVDIAARVFFGAVVAVGGRLIIHGIKEVDVDYICDEIMGLFLEGIKK
ncbi:MAG: TetR/AcrR family transcriptional regulator [Thermoanaerobacteraceae bacterium]|nr:TetR/AcrR family transcriptional regulator [Thermoanaerobacteraceae bacterium]